MYTLKCILQYCGHWFGCYRRHTLSRRRIVPLPRWKADPEMYPEALFPKKTVGCSLVVNENCFNFVLQVKITILQVKITIV